MKIQQLYKTSIFSFVCVVWLGVLFGCSNKKYYALDGRSAGSQLNERQMNWVAKRYAAKQLNCDSSKLRVRYRGVASVQGGEMSQFSAVGCRKKRKLSCFFGEKKPGERKPACISEKN